MSNIALNVMERNTEVNINGLRKSGQTPGIIYGEFLDNAIPIQINNAELKRMLRKNNNGSIIKVDFNNKKLSCVVKEVQKNQRQEILHVDLQYTKPNEVIKMRIPIKCVGQENLELQRLLLETYNLFLDLQGSVEDIPEFIEVNVAEMGFNDKLFAEDISIPENIAVLTDPKTLLAIVSN